MPIIERLIEGLEGADIHVEMDEVPEDIQKLLDENDAWGALFKFGNDLGYGKRNVSMLVGVLTPLGGKPVVVKISIANNYPTTCVVGGVNHLVRLPKKQGVRLRKALKSLWDDLTEGVSM